MTRPLFEGTGGTVSVPQLPLLDRQDGGNLIVNPSRPVWERSELSRDELIQWSFLVAATGRAMLDALPQLADGCINYWEAGNWALNDKAEPAGPKDVTRHRRVHMHLLGRSRASTNPLARWGESPEFPDYSDHQERLAKNRPLRAAECAAVLQRLRWLLSHRYEV